MALKFVGKPVKATSKPFAPAVLVEPQPVTPPLTVPVVSVHPLTPLAALTAEYIGLHQKCEQFEVKPILKRMDEIRKTLMAEANQGHLDKAPVIFTSEAGEIEFSERTIITEIPDPLKLIAYLQQHFGTPVAMSVVEIGLTTLRKVLSPTEIMAFAIEKPGWRTVKMVRPL